MLQVNHVTHDYAGNRVLHDISVKVDKGEIVCLLGPSGCGKSTLLKLIAGMEPCQQGRVCLDERDVTYDSIEARRIGLVFQEPLLFPHVSALENVMFGIQHHADAKTMAQEQLERLGIPLHLYGAKPEALSGGQQQRVAIARAIANAPSMLLLDEPFANLDVVLRQRLRREIVSVLKRSGVPTIIVTHDPQEAIEIADRIYVMEQGRIVQQGQAESLYRNPHTAFVAKMFGPVNVWHHPATSASTIDTPFGAFPLQPSLQGHPLECVVRPDAIDIHDTIDPHEVVAEITAVRFAGHVKNIFLQLENSDISILGCVYGKHELDVSQKVSLHVDNILIFPLTPLKEPS